MRKFFFTIFAMLLMTSVAVAGWNLRQRGDGTAEWVDADGGKYRIAKQVYTTVLEDLSTASTAFVPVPFAGRLEKVDLVVHGNVGGTTETITVSIASATTADGFINITTNNTISVASTIVDASGFFDLGGPGQRYSSGAMTGKAADNANIPSGAAAETANIAPSVASDGVIGISTKGDSGADVDATIFIHFIPD